MKEQMESGWPASQTPLIIDNLGICLYLYRATMLHIVYDKQMNQSWLGLCYVSWAA